MAIPHSVINSMHRSSLAYLRESRHWLPAEMGNGKMRNMILEPIHVCSPTHPNTTFSFQDAAKKNEQRRQKQRYSKEANECSMGAPFEEQKQMAQSKLSRRLGVIRGAKAPKKSKLLGLKPMLL